MGLGSEVAIYPSKDLKICRILLIVSKALKTIAYFSAYEILKQFHTVTFILLLKLSTVFILFPLQKPLSGKSFTTVQWLHLWKFSLVRFCLDALWIEGLRLCGPFRFILLYEHSELMVLAAVSVMFHGSASTSKTRGAVFFIIGIVCMAVFDHDINHDRNAHPEGVHKSIFIHKLYELFSNFGLSDHKIGVGVLLVAVCFDAGFATLSRNMASSIGGAKRFYALTSMLSLSFLAPMFLLLRLYHSLWSNTQVSSSLIDPTGSDSSSEHSAMNNLFMLLLVIFIGITFVTDFYFTALAGARIGSYRAAHLSKFSISCLAFLLCFLWPTTLSLAASSLPSAPPSDSSSSVALNHGFSAGALFSMVTILYASNLLHDSKSGHGSEGGSSGHFIGYSMAGLPLFTVNQAPTHAMSINNQSGSVGFWYHVRCTLKSIMSESSSRRIFAFLCLNLAFTFVELLYGVWTNSLGLISDGFHMLFDSAALVVGLYAAVVSRWKPTRIFSYGFHSAEALSGFVNALFLLIISGSVFVNALARIHRPPHIHTDRLMAVSIAGLLVNLVGVFALGHAHSHGSGCGAHAHSHTGSLADGNHGHSHRPSSSVGQTNHTVAQRHTHCREHERDTLSRPSGIGGDANLRGVYLHVLADTLGSVGVIFSSYLVTTYGWNIADPICSMFLACAIAYSAAPLLYDTVGMLTLRAPALHQPANPEWIVDKVLELDGVLAVYNPFIWSQAPNTTCVSLCVRVQVDIPEQPVLARIQDLISKHCPNVRYLTVQVEKEAVQHALQALGLKPTIVLLFPKLYQSSNNTFYPADPNGAPTIGRRFLTSETVAVMPI